DQAANGVGCGIVRRGVVSASLGTSGVVFAHAEQVSTDPEGRLHTFCHAVPGAWHIMGVVLSAGGALQWFRNALWQEAWAAAKAEGREIYEEITAAAAGAPAGSEGLLFLPYLTGERTPHKDPFARGAFVGLSLRHDRRYLSRAVLEGVAYAMNDSAVLIRNMGVPVDQVRCSGGGARSRLWRQIMADVIDAPMITINVDEGPAYGAAILAAVASGLYGTVEEACDAIIREVDRVEPDAANQVTYAKWFEAYQALYRALAPEYRRIHGLLD
ncbi:MAG TPA: FGGY-family carbohydrate kinase, partial [Candidatus Hydrogenedentes bacterium]|nr:FGGY-family carbohydrate kinase [Candidatus Hydrogenedentota bacterium]